MYTYAHGVYVLPRSYQYECVLCGRECATNNKHELDCTLQFGTKVLGSSIKAPGWKGKLMARMLFLTRARNCNSSLQNAVQLKVLVISTPELDLLTSCHHSFSYLKHIQRYHSKATLVSLLCRKVIL